MTAWAGSFVGRVVRSRQAGGRYSYTADGCRAHDRTPPACGGRGYRRQATICRPDRSAEAAPTRGAFREDDHRSCTPHAGFARAARGTRGPAGSVVASGRGGDEAVGPGRFHVLGRREMAQHRPEQRGADGFRGRLGCAAQGVLLRDHRWRRLEDDRRRSHAVSGDGQILRRQHRRDRREREQPRHRVCRWRRDADSRQRLLWRRRVEDHRRR